MNGLTTPLPPADLVHTVSGNTELEHWAQSRRPAVVDVILPRLREVGLTPPVGAIILDFGCGCGRILAGWEGLLPPGAALYGVDVNPRLAAFCQEHIPFATVSACSYDPPLSFADCQFDLVYAASVFTHLTLPACLRWAAEMARLVKVGDALIVSYHGSFYSDVLRAHAANAQNLLQRDGYYLVLHGEASETFPGSNNYATFMTREFVEALFSTFRLRSHRSGAESGPTHFAAHQDIAVFQRR